MKRSSKLSYTTHLALSSDIKSLAMEEIRSLHFFLATIFQPSSKQETTRSILSIESLVMTPKKDNKKNQNADKDTSGKPHLPVLAPKGDPSEKQNAHMDRPANPPISVPPPQSTKPLTPAPPPRAVKRRWFDKQDLGAPPRTHLSWIQRIQEGNQTYFHHWYNTRQDQNPPSRMWMPPPPTYKEMMRFARGQMDEKERIRRHNNWRTGRDNCNHSRRPLGLLEDDSPNPWSKIELEAMLAIDGIKNLSSPYWQNPELPIHPSLTQENPSIIQALIDATSHQDWRYPTINSTGAPNQAFTMQTIAHPQETSGAPYPLTTQAVLSENMSSLSLPPGSRSEHGRTGPSQVQTQREPPETGYSSTDPRNRRARASRPMPNISDIDEDSSSNSDYVDPLSQPSRRQREKQPKPDISDVDEDSDDNIGRVLRTLDHPPPPVLASQQPPALSTKPPKTQHPLATTRTADLMLPSMQDAPAESRSWHDTGTTSDDNMQYIPSHKRNLNISTSPSSEGSRARPPRRAESVQRKDSPPDDSTDGEYKPKKKADKDKPKKKSDADKRKDKGRKHRKVDEEEKKKQGHR